VTGGHPKVWMVGVDGGMGRISGPFVAAHNSHSGCCVPMLYLSPKLTFSYVEKSLISLAPRAGFEPATQPVNRRLGPP
jgi:hypothetical protein